MSKDNRYTKVPNHVLEAIAALKLNGTQYKILLIVMRLTYGFQRTEREIALPYFSAFANCDKSTISREVSKLKNIGVLIVKKTNNFRNGNVYKINEEVCKNLLGTIDRSVNAGVANRSTSVDESVNEDMQIGQRALTNRSMRIDQSVNTYKEKYKENFKEKYKESESAHARAYGSFKNVFLTEEEFDELNADLGDLAKGYIEKLSCYMKSTGRHYKEHFSTIKYWYIQDREAGKAISEEDFLDSLGL